MNRSSLVRYDPVSGLRCARVIVTCGGSGPSNCALRMSRSDLPHPDVQQCDVDDRGFPFGGTTVQRGCHSARQCDGSHDVPEGRALVQRPFGSGRGQRTAYSPACPVGRAVEPGRLAQRTLLAVARPADVNDLRVHRPDGLELEAQPGAHAGPEVGGEDVSLGDQLMQYLTSLRFGQVEPDGPLAAVGVLEGQVDAVDRGRDPRGPQSSIRIARQRMLHLHHLGTPVGQDRGGQGNEDEGADLDDADTPQDLVHVTPSLLLGDGGRRVRT